MANRTFELVTTIAVSPEFAIDFMVNHDGHKGVHPYFVSAEVVTTGASTDGATTAPGEAGGTVLVEATTVSAPLPVIAYMYGQAQLAHARTFSLLPGEMRTN